MTPSPTGWNTWDVQYHTAVVHLPSGLRMRFGLLTPDGPQVDGFTWRRGLVRLGPHTVDGSYGQAVVTAADTTLDIEFAGRDDTVDARVGVAGSGTSGLLVVVDTMPGVTEEALDFRQLPDGAEMVLADQTWTLTLSSPSARVADLETPGTLWLRVAVPDDIIVRASMCPAESQQYGTTDVDAHVTDAGNAAVEALPSSANWLADGAAAYVRSVTWNTVFAPDLNRVITPTSRDFVCAERDGFYGRWAIHAWDTFFTGLVASWIDPQYARTVFSQITEQADEHGMLPNRVSDDRGRTEDRSQPPVGALTVAKAYLGSGLSDETRDRSLLTSTYPALSAWHDWWRQARRGPFGLLAWGSDPSGEDHAMDRLLDQTKRESGLDDSPMYDDVEYDPHTHTMNLADVGLNALHIADARALADLAERIGESAAAAQLREQADEARKAAHDVLWDEASAGYRNRFAGGRFDPHVSPTLLYPLLAGMPSAVQARAIVDALIQPDVLGGDPPMPSTARDDPGYSTRYWRGRIWAPMVFLAVEGLRRYGFHVEARAIVHPLFDLFLHEWREHSHVRENYPAQRGDDVRALEQRSDGLMSWGSLLAYLAFTELADPRDDGWRFAHPGVSASIARLPLGDGPLTVTATSNRFDVTLGSAPLLTADPHVAVEGYQRHTGTVVGSATARERPGELIVAAPPAADRNIELTVGGITTTRTLQHGKQIRISIPPGETSTGFVLRSSL